MSKERMFALSWVPGLFWLYPMWIGHKDTGIEDLRGATTFYHAAYSAGQIGVLIALICWMIFK